MTTLQLVACVGMIVGAFLIFRISPMDFTTGIFQRLTSAPKSIRSEINETTQRRKKSFLRREIAEAQVILKATGKEARFPVICAVSLLLFAIGALSCSSHIWLGRYTAQGWWYRHLKPASNTRMDAAA